LSGRGRTGRIRGTRELVLAPYIIAYRIEMDAVDILHIYHGAQDWP
jgi:plasmid stabilization system protein ParE